MRAKNSLRRRLARAAAITLSVPLVACAGAKARGGDADAPARDEQPAVVVQAPRDEPAPAEATPVGASAALNENFESDELDVAGFVDRFEGESREVYAQREEIVAALGLRPGEAIADIGAGTGLFTILFAHEVGPEGTVYAVDIARRFLEHLDERAFALGLNQVETVLGTDRTTGLEEGSIDVAYICDTYHHFEYPMDTLASLHAALRPGGRMMIVDFERIPGVSRPWLLEHVRCGKEQVVAEVEAAGFRRLETPHVPGLEENYVLLFERP